MLLRAFKAIASFVRSECLIAIFKGNNAYIFPGVGLAAVACGATRITDLDMYIAAKALAEAVPKVRSTSITCEDCLRSRPH